MDEARLKAMMSGQAGDVKARMLRWVTSLAEPAYTLAVTRRNQGFDQGRRITRLDRPTLSIGNLTTGGTGKTPFVASIASSLLEQGHRPAILLRGYGADDAGQSDEALEYTQRFGDQVPVMPNPDRVAGAAEVLERFPKVTHFLLDDGFQHRQVARDLDVVLIDATQPFGFGHVLPRGLLREPLRGLARADAVVLTRCDQVDQATLREIETTVTQHHGKAPIARTRHAWTGALGSLALDALGEQPVTVALALGNPQGFIGELQRRDVEIARQVIRPDHHAWSAEDVAHLTQSGDAVVTSLKDWVKLQPHWPPQHSVCVPVAGIEFLSGRDTFLEMLG